ncbi:hypothetical protein [Acinetobacter baumannii]
MELTQNNLQAQGKPIPKSPQELQDLLTANSRSAQEGNIKILVLDIDHKK